MPDPSTSRQIRIAVTPVERLCTSCGRDRQTDSRNDWLGAVKGRTVQTERAMILNLTVNAGRHSSEQQQVGHRANRHSTGVKTAL